MKNTLRTHACFVMHGTVQQSERVMRLLTMIMHFHSAVTDSPGAIFTEISQWRWCYVTAALDPAVHIANASHCGGGGGHVLYPGHIQAPAAAAAFQLLLQPSFSHSGLCWAMLLSHGYILSTVQPCSALIPSLWSLTPAMPSYTKQCTHDRRLRHWCILFGIQPDIQIIYWRGDQENFKPPNLFNFYSVTFSPPGVRAYINMTK